MSLTQIDPPLCSLPHLSLWMCVLVRVNTQPEFPLCLRFFCSFSLRDAKVRKIRALCDCMSTNLCTALFIANQKTMITKVKQKRDYKYCLHVCVHLCVHEVMGTVLSLFCGDRWREKFRTGPWQSHAQWRISNGTPRPLTAWHFYHLLSLLVSILLWCLWMQQLLICLAQLL